MPLTRSGKPSDSIEITPLGDSALIIRFRDNADVLSAMRALERAQIPGVIELAPAHGTIGLFYDPEVIAGKIEPARVVGSLGEKIRAALSQRHRRDQVEVRSIDVPVCFDAEFAVDLAEVSARAQLSANEVVDLYCAAEYRVAFLGFTPGFAYLTGLPEKLATPRRAIPRTEIPVGSVAIGGDQTGAYPVASPGGWNVIGRTPLRLFDPNKNPPATLCAGDRVRFHQITRDDFEKEKQ